MRIENEISYATARARARTSGIEKQFRAGRWSRRLRKKNTSACDSGPTPLGFYGAAAFRRVDGRRARRKTQGSDARSEDIARGSSVNPKEVTRGRRPARSATRPRPLTYTTRTLRYRFRE